MKSLVAKGTRQLVLAWATSWAAVRPSRAMGMATSELLLASVRRVVFREAEAGAQALEEAVAQVVLAVHAYRADLVEAVGDQAIAGVVGVAGRHGGEEVGRIIDVEADEVDRRHHVVRAVQRVDHAAARSHVGGLLQLGAVRLRIGQVAVIVRRSPVQRVARPPPMYSSSRSRSSSWISMLELPVYFIRAPSL
jgi:hypothetical protein